MVLDRPAEPRGPLVVGARRGHDLHEHLGALLVEPGHRDPVGRGVAGRDLARCSAATTTR